MARQDDRPPEGIGRVATLALAAVRAVLQATLAGLRVVLPLLRLVLRRVFEVVFALVLLFEEWGWRPLADLLARLARIPWIGRLEAMVANLPPYGALAAFATPSLLILPLKLLALYLIAHGHAVSAALLFVGAKIAGTAIVARLFTLTQPKLMQIGWFARTYNVLMPWKDRAFAAIRASWAWRYGRIVKHKVSQAMRARWAAWRPFVLAWRERAVAQGRELARRARGWLAGRSRS